MQSPKIYLQNKNNFFFGTYEKWRGSLEIHASQQETLTSTLRTKMTTICKRKMEYAEIKTSEAQGYLFN